MKTRATVKVRLCSCLIFPLDNGEWSGSRPDRFHHGKESPGGYWMGVTDSLDIYPEVAATVLSQTEQSTENVVRNRTTDVQSTILRFHVQGTH